MRAIHTPEGHRRPRSRCGNSLRWTLAGALNLALGYAGILPFAYISLVLECGLFPRLGWSSATDSKYAENPGLYVMLAVGAALFMGLAFLATNYLYLLTLTARARLYWPLASVVLPAPYVLVRARPELWASIGWW
ncbi:hypothetical protein [Streptomyces sp. SID3343]|uniref:hypothetical protein n=1 Tax=Streptomyces sp. SID3343 TaxID=2690260 RepID=UPI00136A21A1|nr:hypothetical protein [Streptomyces sp. SID3343]MYW03882.1 hypothetical protein [Streptomyces sp. SID3343]